MNEIAGTLDRVLAAGYSRPAHARLLDALGERLAAITPREPAELPAAGLTVADWLAAVELRRRVLVDLIERRG